MLDRFPAIVGISSLTRGGWSVGRGSADDHVPGGSKVFRMRGTDPASKMYYIMVSHLPLLFAAGLEAFPCDGDEVLYRNVSAGECPKAEVQKCHERQSAAAKRGVRKEGQGDQLRAERDMVVDVEGGTPAGPEMAGPARPEMKTAGVAGDDAVDWSAPDVGVGYGVGAPDAEEPARQDGSDEYDGPRAPGFSTDGAHGAPTAAGASAGAG